MINFSNGYWNVTIGEVDHVTLSSRENAVISKKIDFSLVNDEFQPSTFPIGLGQKLGSGYCEILIKSFRKKSNGTLHLSSEFSTIL